MTTETLRAAIEAALRRRYGENTSAKVSPLAHDSGWHSVRSWAETGAWPMLVHATTRALPTEIDAMHALAAFVGLRDNGSDPAEEVERFTRERDEARADAALAREAYSIDLAGLRDALRRADDLRVMWRERVADVASERDALRTDLAATRAALRANLRCDECDELATRAHADTARFGCEAHGVGEGWADTTHAAVVREALR